MSDNLGTLWTYVITMGSEALARECNNEIYSTSEGVLSGKGENDLIGTWTIQGNISPNGEVNIVNTMDRGGQKIFLTGKLDAKTGVIDDAIVSFNGKGGRFEFEILQVVA